MSSYNAKGRHSHNNTCGTSDQTRQGRLLPTSGGHCRDKVLLLLVRRHGFLVCTTSLEGTVQTVVPKSLRPRFLYLEYYPKLVGCPGECCMYDTMRSNLYWTHMTSDVYTKVSDCRECAVN